MIKIRLIFEKAFPAQYLSHLDLMAVFARSCTRASLALHFSEGYNPHPYLSVACPLPVGLLGQAEVLDIGLREETDFTALVQSLNAALPPGLKITRAYRAETKAAMIRWASYALTLRYEAGLTPDRFTSLQTFYQRVPLLMNKKSKGQNKTVDVSELIHHLVWSCDGQTVGGSAILAAGACSLNALRLPSLLPEDLRPFDVEVTRLSLLDEHFEPFV